MTVADRLPMLFNFMLNQRAVPGPGPRGGGADRSSAGRACRPCRDHAQWATFLRNHDEVDLVRLSARTSTDDVFAAFGPDRNMQLYGRGIRRRLAPMLGGDRRGSR